MSMVDTSYYPTPVTAILAGLDQIEKNRMLIPNCGFLGLTEEVAMAPVDH